MRAKLVFISVPKASASHEKKFTLQFCTGKKLLPRISPHLRKTFISTWQHWRDGDFRGWMGGGKLERRMTILMGNHAVKCFVLERGMRNIFIKKSSNMLWINFFWIAFGANSNQKKNKDEKNWRVEDCARYENLIWQSAYFFLKEIHKNIWTSKFYLKFLTLEEAFLISRRKKTQLYGCQSVLSLLTPPHPPSPPRFRCYLNFPISSDEFMELGSFSDFPLEPVKVLKTPNTCKSDRSRFGFNDVVCGLSATEIPSIEFATVL